MSRKKRIFIVEDNQLVAELLGNELKSILDCEIEYFNSTQEILNNLLRCPDLIILDYYLEQEDSDEIELGLNILKKVKKINPNIPVMIFSGQQELKTAMRLFSNGAIEYIDKNDEHFLEDMVAGVRRIMDYNDSNESANEIKEVMRAEYTQIFTLTTLTLIFTLIVYFF